MCFYLQKVKLHSPLYRDDLVDPLAVSPGLKGAVFHGGSGAMNTPKVGEIIHLEGTYPETKKYKQTNKLINK